MRGWRVGQETVEKGMYTALGWLSCKNCNLSVSAGSDIKESRGK